MSLENINNTSSDSEEISLKELILNIRDWWRYLVSKSAVIVGFGILGGLLGLAYSYVKKPVYTASTTFVLEDEKGGGGLGNLAGLASIAGVDLAGSGGGIFQGDNILGLYKSRTMLEKTLLTQVESGGKKQLLVDRFIEINHLREKLADKSGLVNVNFFLNNSRDGYHESKQNRLRDSVLGVIVTELNKNYLDVTKPDKALSTIRVNVKAEDEFFAKAFNDELVKNVNEFFINTKTKKTVQNVQILQHKTDSIRIVMNGAIYSAVAVSDATPNLNPTRQVQRVAPAQKAQFSAETNKAVLGELVKNLELAKISLLKETPLIQLIDKPIYPLKVDRLGRLKGFVFGIVLGGGVAMMCLIVRRLFENL